MTEQTHLPGIEDKISGFFYGYVIVIASFISMLVVNGSMYSFGVFFKPLLEEFGWTRATTSGAYSLNFVLQGIYGIFVGRLSDRFGPRAVVTVCGLVLGLGYLLMPQVHAIWHIYLFFGIFVSTGSCIYVPVMSTTARWFVKRRGLMSGVISAGIGAGITIVPPIANHLIAVYNWRTAYVIVGLTALMVVVTIAQFLKLNPHRSVQTAYSNKEVKTKSQANISGLSLGEAVKTRELWLICGIAFLANFFIQTIMVHLVPHATDIGIPAATAAFILSVIGILSIGTKLGMGNIIDRLDGKRVIVISLIFMLGGFLWIRFASDLWMFYLFALIFAISYAGLLVVLSPIVAEYFGLRAHGAIFGIVFLANCLGGAFGSLATGRIFDVYNSYNSAFIICAVLSMLGLLLLVPLKPIFKD